MILAENSPEAFFTCIDISEGSLHMAERRTKELGISNVEFRQADLFQLPFRHGSFDAVFVCFVLEHMREPGTALLALREVLKEGGDLTVIEGDHGSCFFHPDSERARGAIDCLVRDQAALGGDANIGRRLFPLLSSAGFHEVKVSPRMVYVDASRPSLAEGFTRNTFIAMVAGVRERAIASGSIDPAVFDKGLADLERTCERDGTFCYTFFKGNAKK